MKFEYNSKSEERECVAYIDGDGDLCMRDGNEYVDMIALGVSGASTYKVEEFDQSEATHRFYPGDKLTITF